MAIFKSCLTSLVVFLCLILLLGVGFDSGIVHAKGDKKKKGGPPSWAPAHGYRAKQKYTYYPRQEVYYSSEQKEYFWLDGGSWKVGVKLPDSIKIGGSGVTVELDTDKPYTQHSTVKKKHPKK